MTNYETLKTQVKTWLQKIVELELAKSKAIADCKYTDVSGSRFFVGAEIWAAKKKAIQDDYDGRIKAIHEEIASLLDATQKAANQEYAAAVPRPTAEEWPEIQSMIQRYQNSTEPNKERDFIEQRDFHVENETRLARIYVFAGRDLGITKAAMTDDASRDNQWMQAIHRVTANITGCIRLEEEELLLRIAPTLKTAQEHIDAVMDARRFYAIFEMLALQEQMRDMNPDNFSHAGMFSSWDEVKAARIATKTRLFEMGGLFEMGANPNIDLVAFMSSEG